MRSSARIILEIPPPEKEKLHVLAEALGKRPQLKVVVQGFYSPESDGFELKAMTVRRSLAARQGVVMEGRDIGSVVFPLATTKIYLDASAEARAERRWRQFRERGQETERQAVLADLRDRDRQDSSRAESPLTISPDAKVYDGRFANNAWLQELPDPFTKLTWDNAALMGQNTAAELGYENGDMITLTVGDSSVNVPVLVNPGQSDFTIQLALGYYGDQKEVGSIASGVGCTNSGEGRTTPWPRINCRASSKATGGR